MNFSQFFEKLKGKWVGWDPLLTFGDEISELTIGIIGCGRIGLRFAEMCSIFHPKRILYYNRSPLSSEKLQNFAQKFGSTLEYVPNMEALLAESDVVSLHTPATKETVHLINENNLKLFKDGAYLINTARFPFCVFFLKIYELEDLN